jgi:hypothetical protein
MKSLVRDAAGFDPGVLSVFAMREQRLRQIYEALAPNVA